LSARRELLKAVFIWVFASLACSASAQTYQVGPAGTVRPPQNQSDQSQPAGQSLGWGSNIQNARLGRAAELALQHHNYAQAYEYAQRAAHAAPNDPQLWFLLGYSARLNGAYAASVDAYTNGLRLDPSSPDGQSGLAQVYGVMGRTEDAERIFKQVVAANPSRRDDLVSLAELSMKSRNYADALDWLNRAERVRPDARSEVLLAISYEQLKQPDQAQHYLELAQRRSPGNPDLLRTEADFYREVGKYADAIKALRSIRNPGPDVVAELAYTYQLDGNYEDSAKYFSQAANAQPRNLTFQLSAAQAQVAIGAYSGATPFLDRARQINANDYRVHALNGEIAKLNDHDQDAVHEYTAALAALPPNPPEGQLYGIQLHMDLYSLDQSLEDDSAAHRELETAQLEINQVNGSGPDRVPFLRLRSLIKLSAGDPNGALADINQALAIDRSNRDNLQLDGDILVKLGQTAQAISVFQEILKSAPQNRAALTALGYAQVEAKQGDEAEKTFERLAQVAPSSYVPFLALGDLYTARREFDKAQNAYSKAYAIEPQNALIAAGGINAGIEAHNLALAGKWLSRVTPPMEQEPKVLREKERYLSFEGKYQESESVGLQAIKVLPDDRDVVVYLGYDMLNQAQYDQLLDLTSKYWKILPEEPDIPLLAGYVHKHQGMDGEALADFSEVLKRDPSVVTAYVNRGYLLNDLHKPQAAASDFEAALGREPHNGEAHLGLAYADLDLRKPQGALREAKLAEDANGDSKDLHVIRATAYGDQDMLTLAAREYRAALKFSPNDSTLHFGLGNTLFSARQYDDAIKELEEAEKLAPDLPQADALLARCYAGLHNRDQTLHYVQLAEQHMQAPSSKADLTPVKESDLWISIGDALSTLGDLNAAMDLFRKALAAPEGDRVGVRLAIAQVLAQQGHTDDAERQVALAWMEAEAGDTAPPTGSQFILAADLFRSMHDYQLSQTYLQSAKLAGAPDAEVRIGLADNYLALGDTVKAKAELSAISDPLDSSDNYQYLLAKAAMFQQEQQNAQALTAFAQAASAQGEDQSAVQGMIETSGNEGLRISPEVSVLSDLTVSPIFEDPTIYVLDSKLDATFAVPPSDTSQLPPPRSSLQTQWTDAFHLHFGSFLPASGFFQLRNAQGAISVPATNSIVNRNTTDSTFNFALDPTLHLGDNVLTFNGGVQGTVRRDTSDPVDMDQNLFRVYAYMNTSSFFNAVSVSGYAFRESGPFTEMTLHSRELAGSLNFRVGAPWGKNALLTGWGVDDQVYMLIHTEDYFTSAYIGFDHKFSPRLDVNALAEDVRAWRIFGTRWGIAQNLRPAGSVDFIPRQNWDVKFTSAYSSTRGFHVYDATQNGFSVSYARPFRHIFHDRSAPFTVQYPLRFSAGVQEESFFNFTGAQNQQFRPYAEITIF
jgi:tetratricopeptide (TPR) repeat protein